MYTRQTRNPFSSISPPLHTHAHARMCTRAAPLNRRNTTSEERDRGCPFSTPLVRRGGSSGAESSVGDATASAAKTSQTDYSPEEREREGRGAGAGP